MSASTPAEGTVTPAASAPPETKRRSRRGCMPCRKRHRKCDEQKPRCGSCQERNVACAYKPLTWISESHSASSATKSRASVGAPSATLYRPSSTPTSAHVASPSPSIPLGTEPQAVLASASTLASASVTTRISMERGPALAEGRGLPVATTSTRDMSISSLTGTADGITAAGPVEPFKLADILRSFRYDIAPLIDANAPRSSFAVDILELARTSNVILQAITLVVEARLATSQSISGRIYPDDRVTSAHSSSSDGFLARVENSLLTLSGFFGIRPSDWTGISVQYPRDVSMEPSLQSVREPLQSLLRFQIKTELAQSLRCKRPLSEALLSWVRHHPMSAADAAPQIVHNASLCQLARCLDLVNNRPSVFSERRTRTQQNDTLDASGDFDSAWSTQWALCNHWYQTRSPDMIPILETTALEAAALATGGPGFPVSVHTSPISLQANVNIHLACLLLLKHKPGLSAATRPQQPFESRSWHSEKIAGSVVWNTYKEQWDPILLGAVLFIAEDMTHPAQQRAIEDCLQRISREVGVDLRQETTDLGHIWKAFQEDFNVDFDY